MGFLDISTTFNPSATLTKTIAGQTGLATPGQLTTLASQTSTQLVNELRQKVTSFAGAQFSSVANVFGGDTKALASSLTKRLSSIFGDTIDKPASSVTTKTSDPLQTLSKKPTSSAFVLGSLQTGSTSTGSVGSISQVGSLADYMIGTQFSTVLDRFSLDNKEALASVVTTSTYKEKLAGLFTKFTTDANGLITGATSATGITVIDPKNPIFGIGDIKLNITEAIKDIGSYTNAVQSLDSSVTNRLDIFSYYTKNLSNEVVNTDGNSVATTKLLSGSSANSVLNLLRQTGCALTNSDYRSAFDIKSIFNTGLLAAASKGMLQEVTDLISCSQSNTAWGQDALRSVFTSVVGDDVDMASTVLRGVTDKTAVSSSDVMESLFTNPNLTASDRTTVSGMLTSLGSNPGTLLTIPSASSSDYAVWDLDILENTQPVFMNAILQSSDMDTVINGTLVNPNTLNLFT